MLGNVEFHNFYSVPNIIGMAKWVGHVFQLGQIKAAYKALIGNSAGNIRLVSGYKDVIKINPKCFVIPRQFRLNIMKLFMW